MVYIRPEQKKSIQDQQVQLANLLKQSFYFARQDRNLQLQFLCTARTRGLNIFEFRTEEILDNEHILSELSTALESKHPGKVKSSDVYEVLRYELDDLKSRNRDT